MEMRIEKCEILKAIRSYVAEKYGLDYNPAECDHDGDCPGTCPQCDAELADLQRQLEAKGICDIEQDETLKAMLRQLIGAGAPTPEQKDNASGMSLPTIPKLQGMPMPAGWMELNEPQYDRKVILQCPVAGLSFHNINDIWDELYEGAEVALVRQRKNKYDRNAVAVALADDYDGDPEEFDFDYILGYIPRHSNQAIAALLDMGWDDILEAEITQLNEKASYSDRVHITVYVRSKDPVSPKEPSLRTASLSIDDWKDFTHCVWENGFAFFRWGGFPPDAHDLPKKGDKVVFLQHGEKETEMYLMTTIAKGNSCENFVDDLEDMIDDCMPYVLNVVKGPILVKNEEIDFLGDDLQVHSQPEGKLAPVMSSRLLSLFE